MRTLFIIFIFLTCTICQAQNDAKSILDKTSSLFSKSSGTKAEFTLQLLHQGKLTGDAEGNISLKNDKFIMETTDGITWFNGKTQWSYLFMTEEVNITNPTEEELQSINPYILLNSYKKNYNASLGQKTSYGNKQIHEVILTPMNPKSEFKSVTLYIQKFTYHPVYIEVNQKDNSVVKINATNYLFNQNYQDNLFTFDKKKYPGIEEIDLR